jgi:putative sporulation protein YtaF
MQTVLLLIALSCDVFLASAACGAEQIQIKRKTALCVGIVCSGVLFLSFLAGTILDGKVDKQTANVIGFAVFFLIGIWKLTEYALKRRLANMVKICFSRAGWNVILKIYHDPTTADRDCSHTMSVTEGILFALAMSADGFLGGFGMGASAYHPMTLFLNLLVTYIAVRTGSVAGRAILRRETRDLSWVAGVVFILLACVRQIDVRI